MAFTAHSGKAQSGKGWSGASPPSSFGFSVTVPAGTLALAGYAPSVPSAFSVTVPVGALSLTGFAPSLTRSLSITIPVGTLGLTGYVPVINNDGFPDFSAYVFEFDAIGIMDHKSGVWTQRAGSSPGIPPYSYLYSDFAAYAGGAIPYNVFNGRNNAYSVVAKTPAANHGGIIDSDDWTSVHSRMVWLGSGIPPYEQPVLTTDLDNSNQPLMLPTIDAVAKPETGAWFVNGKYWFIGLDTFNGCKALFSCPNPGVGGNWTYVAPGTGPTASVIDLYYKASTHTAYLLVQTATNNVEFYSINISASTPTWTGPFAAFDPTVLGIHGILYSRVIVFDNGDLGVYFQLDDGGSGITGTFYYKRYNTLTTTWDAAVTLLSRGFCSTFLIDPTNPDLIYIFVDVLTQPAGLSDAPVCMTVTRMGVSATVFSFPTSTPFTSGSAFSQGITVGNKLLIPLPAVGPQTFATNAVWISSLGGSTFTPLQIPDWISQGGAAGANTPWLFKDQSSAGYVFMKGGSGGVSGNHVGC